MYTEILSSDSYWTLTRAVFSDESLGDRPVPNTRSRFVTLEPLLTYDDLHLFADVSDRILRFPRAL